MKLILANFKMNLLKKDINNYLNIIENKINKEQVIFFPSNIYLFDFYKKTYLVGSQDISFKEFGAVTGDISIKQLQELGISYTIIGHSERRKYYNDNDYINEKINLALRNNIKIVLCIGENFNQNNDLTKEFIEKQIDDALKDNISFDLNENLIIAYEPIWSIGTGIIPDNSSIFEIVNDIKEYLKNKYNLDIKVLYGGSVNKENISSLEKITNLDGYLVGNASLDPKNFLDLISQIK